MSDSVRPHRWQPTRLCRPWDSPGKTAGVGCHFLLQCRKVKNESELVQSYLTLCKAIDCSLPGSSVHGIFQARVLDWVAIAFSRRTIWIFLKKLKIKLPYDPAVPLLIIYPEKTMILYFLICVSCLFPLIGISAEALSMVKSIQLPIGCFCFCIL